MARNFQPSQAEVDELRTEATRAEHELENAKLAYYNSAPYKDEPIMFDRLKEYAEGFVRANHALQKALYGRIRIRLDVSRLLRE